MGDNGNNGDRRKSMTSKLDEITKEMTQISNKYVDKRVAKNLNPNFDTHITLYHRNR